MEGWCWRWRWWWSARRSSHQLALCRWWSWGDHSLRPGGCDRGVNSRWAGQSSLRLQVHLHHTTSWIADQRLDRLRRAAPVALIQLTHLSIIVQCTCICSGLAIGSNAMTSKISRECTICTCVLFIDSMKKLYITSPYTLELLLAVHSHSTYTAGIVSMPPGVHFLSIK